MKKQRPKIKIKNTQRKITINKQFITHLAKQVLKIKGKVQAELSILVVGKKYIRSLNRKFRKIDEPSDVLAFPMGEGTLARKNRVHPEVLGDVVICPEVACQFARIYHTTKEQEIYLYLVHGILHLLGYDDTQPKNRTLMKREEARILKKILK